MSRTTSPNGCGICRPARGTTSRCWPDKAGVTPDGSGGGDAVLTPERRRERELCRIPDRLGGGGRRGACLAEQVGAVGQPIIDHVGGRRRAHRGGGTFREHRTGSPAAVLSCWTVRRCRGPSWTSRTAVLPPGRTPAADPSHHRQILGDKALRARHGQHIEPGSRESRPRGAVLRVNGARRSRRKSSIWSVKPVPTPPANDNWPPGPATASISDPIVPARRPWPGL